MAYDPVTGAFEEAQTFERSPTTQAILAGIKGALLGGPIAAGIQALRGKSATTGAILGVLGGGVAAALAKGVERKLENLNNEAVLRYHAEQILNREPYFFMPSPQNMRQVFTGFHDQAHGLRYPIHAD
jgi:hypothetical protein